MDTDVLVAKPFLLLGNRVQRLCLRHDVHRFLVNATQIWKLSNLQPSEQAARFVDGRNYPIAYMFVSSCMKTARLAVSPTADAGGALFVAAELLPQLLMAPDGLALPLRATADRLDADVHDASCQNPSALQHVEHDRELKVIAQQLASDDLSMASLVESKAGSDRSAETAEAQVPVIELSPARRKAFRVTLVLLLLGVLAVMVLLVFMFMSMAQQGCEQPGGSYLTVINELVASIMKFALYPSREATDILVHMAGA